MLDDRGNTAVYLLYAYTRIRYFKTDLTSFINWFYRSIIRVSGVSDSDLKEAAVTTPIGLSHEKELKLAKCIVRFPEVLADVMTNLYPHTLCDYLYELCTTMTEFYDACYCVEKDTETEAIIRVDMSRILLCEATRMVLHQAFNILGIDPVEKM